MLNPRTGSPASKQQIPQPDPKIIDALLDRLSTDDAFRERLLGDPVEALAEYGISADPDAIPMSRSLPSKQQLRTDRETVRMRLSAEWFIFVWISGPGRS